MRKTLKNLPENAIFLPDIRSAYNVGSIFRTCDAAGIGEIYLAGHSPCPTDRFGRKRKDVAKTSLGAEDTVVWKYIKSPVTALKNLKKEGFYVIAVEQTPGSIDYKKIKLRSIKMKEYKKGVLFVFGNEVNGISKNLLKLADIVVDIPMSGGKESMNVSVAAGVAIFRILNI